MKKEYLLIPILIAVLQWILFQFLLIPQVERKFQKNEETRLDLVNRLTTAKVLQNNLGEIHQLIQANSYKEPVNENLEEKQVLSIMTDAAIQQHLQLMSIKPMEALVMDSYHVHPYTLKLSGSYKDLGNFLAQMENQKKVFFIREYSLGPSELKDIKGVTANIVFETYRMIPQ